MHSSALAACSTAIATWRKRMYASRSPTTPGVIPA
jgi:hypothetical protein